MARFVFHGLISLGMVSLFIRSLVAAPDVKPLLDQITTQSATARMQAFKDLVAMGDGGVVAVAGQLTEPKVGEAVRDAGARIALHGMAVQVSRPGAEKERAAFVKPVVRLLEGDRPAFFKRFLIEQLQIAGRDDAVPVLAVLLRDKDVAESARQALEANRTDAAIAALRKALPDSKGLLRVGIINSLGTRRDKAAVKALIAEAKDSTETVRCAALVALGKIGDPSAKPAIEAALNSPSAAVKRAATEAESLLSDRAKTEGK